MIAGLAARNSPRTQRYVPTAWLVLSLAMTHGSRMLPGGSLPPATGPTLRVLTLNLSQKVHRRPAAIAYLKRRRSTDLVFLQEVRGNERKGDRPRLLAALSSRYPHSIWHEGPILGDFQFGLGIMSRYPLSEARRLELTSGYVTKGVCSQTFVLIAKIKVRGKTARVATTHLCPPRIQWRDRNLREVGIRPGTMRDWLLNVRANEYARRSQFEFLGQIAAGGVDPLVLGGDLNAAPYSLDLLVLLKTMKSAFDEMGFGFTFASGLFKVRADHVFYSDGFGARSASVPDVKISNHKPVEAVLEFLP